MALSLEARKNSQFRCYFDFQKMTDEEIVELVKNMEFILFSNYITRNNYPNIVFVIPPELQVVSEKRDEEFITQLNTEYSSGN